jgi:hypothetical protein
MEVVTVLVSAMVSVAKENGMVGPIAGLFDLSRL